MSYALVPPIASFARLSRSRASDLLFLFRAPVKADTHEGFCSRSMLLRVYQRFHGYTSSSGAEFPPYKMFHDIQAVKYLGSSSRSKLSELENAPSCLLTLACSGSKTPRVYRPSSCLQRRTIGRFDTSLFSRLVNCFTYLA